MSDRGGPVKNATGIPLAKILAALLGELAKIVASPIQYTNPSWWLTAATTVGSGLAVFGTNLGPGAKSAIGAAGAAVVAVFTHEHHASQRHADTMAVEAAKVAATSPGAPSLDDVVGHVLGALTGGAPPPVGAPPVMHPSGAPVPVNGPANGP